MLVNAGVNVNTQTIFGATALSLATLHGNLNTVLVLLEHGAEVNLYSEGFTPLHAATGLGIYNTEKNDGESFQETINRLGFSEDNFLQMTKALVEAGADVYAQSYPENLRWFERLLVYAQLSRTPYDYAKSIGSREVANYLKSVMEKSKKRKWYWPF